MCQGSATTYHTQQPRSSMLHGEVLILEIGAVDRERACAVVVHEVATLDHELGDTVCELSTSGNEWMVDDGWWIVDGW